MRLHASLLVLLAAPAVAQTDGDLFAHWRFAPEHLRDGNLAPLEGAPALRASASPTFLGAGDDRAVAFGPGAGHFAAPGGVAGAELPRRRLTVEAWVGVDRAAPWGGFLSAVEDAGDRGRGWLLGHKGDRFVFGLATEGTGGLVYLSAPQAFRPGRWYHVAGVYDGKRQELYVDGELVAESTEASGDILYDERHQLVAGAKKDSNEDHPLVGALYEARFSGRALGKRDFQRRVRELAARLPAPPEGTTLGGVALERVPTVREMQPAISAAIDRGAAWLLARQHRDGSWESHQDAYRSGMTALACYTLLKQGVAPAHPSLRRAFAFLRERPPTKTYSAGCLLLALAATGDESHAEWAQEIVDLLVQWENDAQPGGYGYPGGAIDLSNTQYAALGLWAAAKLGVEAPDELWQRLVETTCGLHQEEPAEVDWEDGDTGRTGKRRIAGFSYRPGQAGHATSGSMTAAGLCVIGTAREAAGRGLGRRAGKAAERAERMAFDWLDHHWSVERNPGMNGRHLYYLYGLERLGALFDTETIGAHEWYREGARQLIKMQQPDGSWTASETETCFALLFLSRATASSTGPGATTLRTTAWESREGDVFLRVTGTGELAMWITGFAEALLAPGGAAPDARPGLRVARVEYLVDDRVVATVAGDTARVWDAERFPARYALEALGPHTLRARVSLAAFDGARDLEVVESAPLAIEATLSAEEWMARQREPEGLAPLVLELAEVTASSPASEEVDRGHWAGRATDGFGTTRWLCAADDAEPWLRLELREPAVVEAVRLSPATSALHLLGQYAAVPRVRVVVDGREEYELELDPDGLTPALLTFERAQKVRRVEVRLLDRTLVGKKRAGLAEVELLAEPAPTPRRRR